MTLKMPKELEMPKMKDHQMFDQARIVELQDELQDNFKALKVSGMRCGMREGRILCILARRMYVVHVLYNQQSECDF